MELVNTRPHNMAIFADIPIFGAVILAAFGVLFCAFGLTSIQRTRMFRTRGTRHEATVTDIAVFGHGEGRRSYQPTFQFTDAQGVAQTKSTNGGSSGYEFDIGSTQAILDVPGSRHVILADKRDGDVFGIAVLLGGVVCLVMGLSAIVY